MEVLLALLILAVDFIITAIILKLIVFILGCLGFGITLTWGGAFGVWCIIKLLRMIWPSGK